VQKLERALIEIGDELVAGLRAGLDDANSNASGNLKASIDYNAKVFVSKSGKFGFEFTLLMDSYWVFVDKGRRPGKMPPVSDIIEWIRFKESFKPTQQTTAKGSGKAGRVSKVKKVTGSKQIVNKVSGANKLKKKRGGSINYKGIAYAIALKIKKEGTKGTNFYSKMIDQKFFDTFSKRVEDAMFVDIDEMITTRIVG